MLAAAPAEPTPGLIGRSPTRDLGASCRDGNSVPLHIPDRGASHWRARPMSAPIYCGAQEKWVGPLCSVRSLISQAGRRHSGPREVLAFEGLLHVVASDEPRRSNPIGVACDHLKPRVALAIRRSNVADLRLSELTLLLAAHALAVRVLDIQLDRSWPLITRQGHRVFVVSPGRGCPHQRNDCHHVQPPQRHLCVPP